MVLMPSDLMTGKFMYIYIYICTMVVTPTSYESCMNEKLAIGAILRTQLSVKA